MTKPRRCWKCEKRLGLDVTESPKFGLCEGCYYLLGMAEGENPGAE
jgi:hypothetical protein